MPIYTRGGLSSGPSFVQDFETGFLESLSAATEEGWRSSYWDTFRTAARRAEADAEGPSLSREQAAARIKESGVPGLEPVDGISQAGLDFLIERKWAEVRTADTLSRARSGYMGEQSVARFVASLGVGLFDPVNLAVSFFPASWLFRSVGLTRAAAATERLALTAKEGATVGARLGAAAGVGAIEGAVGTVALEPFYAATRSWLQDDYGMADSLVNVAAGGLFGGGLHASIRGVREVAGALRARAGVADAPVLEDVVARDDTGPIGGAGGGAGGGGGGGGRAPAALQGSATSVRFGADLVVPARYAVFEADDLQALTDKSDAQYRDRTRAAYQAELQQRANELDFEFLHAFAGADHGAPVLTVGGGPIVAGNGRTLMIQRAYDIGTGADRYKAPLVARAGEFGLDPRRVEAMRNPVLVRVLDRQVDVRRAAQLSNEAGATPMSALELAKVDAERLGDIRGVEVTESGSLRTAGNRGLMRRWLEAQPENQRNALVDRDGYLSNAGLRRVQNAILYRAYGDTPMLARLVESADPGARNVVAGLTRAAAAVAEGRAAVARGELHAVDLVPALEEAVQTFADLRERGVNVPDWLANGELVDGISPEAKALVGWFDERARSPSSIAAVVEGFYRQLERRGAPGQADMFGGSAAPTAGGLLEASIAEARAVLPSAADQVEAADPVQRNVAAQAAVVQTAQGRAVDVAAVIDGTPAEVVAAAARSAGEPGSVLMADEAAAAAAGEHQSAGPASPLEEASAAASDAMDEVARVAAQGAQAWKYARYYHGTPGRFMPEPGAALGLLRWQFINSGEGAQAFGYGHYVAEREVLARERYRDRLLGRATTRQVIVGWADPWRFEDFGAVEPSGLHERSFADPGAPLDSSVQESLQELLDRPGGRLFLAEALRRLDAEIRADPRRERGALVASAMSKVSMGEPGSEALKTWQMAVGAAAQFMVVGDLAGGDAAVFVGGRNLVVVDDLHTGGTVDAARAAFASLGREMSPRARGASGGVVSQLVRDVLEDAERAETRAAEVEATVTQLRNHLDKTIGSLARRIGWGARVVRGDVLSGMVDAVDGRIPNLEFGVFAASVLEFKRPGEAEWRRDLEGDLYDEFFDAAPEEGGKGPSADQLVSKLYHQVAALRSARTDAWWGKAYREGLALFTAIEVPAMRSRAGEVEGVVIPFEWVDGRGGRTAQLVDLEASLLATREVLALRESVSGKRQGNDAALRDLRESVAETERQLAIGRWRYIENGAAPIGDAGLFTTLNEAKEHGDAVARERPVYRLRGDVERLDARDMRLVETVLRVMEGDAPLSSEERSALVGWLEEHDPKRMRRAVTRDEYMRSGGSDPTLFAAREQIVVEHPGSVYTIDIPDAVHDRMLRWDDLVDADSQPAEGRTAMAQLLDAVLADWDANGTDGRGRPRKWLEAYRVLVMDAAAREEAVRGRAQQRVDERIADVVMASRSRGPSTEAPAVAVVERGGTLYIVEARGRGNEFGVVVPENAPLSVLRALEGAADGWGPAALRDVLAEEARLAAERWAELNDEMASRGLTREEEFEARLRQYREALEDDDELRYEELSLVEDTLYSDADGAAVDGWYRGFAVVLANLRDGPGGRLGALIDAAVREIEARRGLQRGAYGGGRDASAAWDGEEVLSVMLWQAGVPGHLFHDGFTRGKSSATPTFNAVLYGDDVGVPVDRYARSAKAGPGALPESARLMVRAVEEFGDGAQALLKAGRIVVVDAVKDLPGSGHPPDVMAATAPDGTVYVVAGNVVPARLRGLVLHEVGVHVGLERMVGREAFLEILGQMRRLVEEGDAAAVAARESVPADTAADLVDEETLGYLVMQEPTAPLVTRLLAAVRAWMIKQFPSLARRFRLDVADLRALAVAALGREARAARAAAGRPAVAATPRLLASPEHGDAAEQQFAYARDPTGPRDVKEELRALDALVERARAYRSALQAAAGVADDRRPEMMRAAMPDLSAQEIQILLDELKAANIRVRGSLRSVRDALQAEDAAAAMQDEAQRAADMAANNLEMSAVIRKRGEALSLAARVRGLAFVMSQFDRGAGKARGNWLAEGFMALVGGTEHKAVGNRASVALEQQQFQAKWAGGLVHDLEKAGLWDVFMSDALALETAKALEAIGTARGTGGLDRRAVAMATIIRKHQENARVTRNRFGAWVRELRGYVVRQSHDSDKVYAAGQLEWTRFVAERLNARRTFGRDGMSQREVAEALAGLWQDFSSGNHTAEVDADMLAAFSGPANLARRQSTSRELYFRDATAWWEYHQRFGTGGLAGAVLEQMMGAARAAGLLKVLGTNPEASLTRMMDEVSAALTDDPMARKQFDSRRQQVLDLLHHADGSTNRPGSAMGAQVSAVARGMSTIAKLGGSVISSVADVPVYGQAVREAGGSLFGGMGRAIGSLLEGVSSGERKDVLSALGVYFDSMIGGTIARFDADGRYPGWMTRTMQAYFKFNLLTPWTERLRTSAALTFAHMLGLAQSRAWGALNPDLRARLEAVKVDEARWNVLRLASKTEADGRLYLTPDGLRDVPRAALENYLALVGREVSPTAVANLREDLAGQLRAFYIDMAHHAVVEPDLRVRHWMLRGTQPGTVPGEMLRFMGQFKAFPVAMARMVLGRAVYGRGYQSLADFLRRGRGDVLALVELMLVMTAFGYGAMTVKDLLKGRKPRPVDSLATWTAAFAQGGGLGIYGDFLFGEMRNRYGGGLTDTLAGPVVGTAADVADLYGRWRAGDDTAAAALRLAVNQTPFINVFYLRFALDYLLLYRLQEAVNPGYLRRMEGRIRRENAQEFWLRPSEVVR